MPLDVLPLDEAVAFLQDRAGRKDEAGAAELAEAARPAAARARSCRGLLQTRPDALLGIRGGGQELIAGAPRGAGYPRSVAATFDLAIADAVAQCPAAEALMAFLAQCGPERIPMTLVEGAIEDASERRQALTALAEVSLVKQDPFADGTPAVTVHRLVQAVARARSEAEGTTQDAIERLIARLAALYPDDGFRQSAIVATLRAADPACPCAARSGL